MKATMFLCDSAQVANGKLYIMGGGWSTTGPDPTPSAVAIKLDVAASEIDQVHDWSIALTDADGRHVPIDTGAGPRPIEVKGTFAATRPPDMTDTMSVDVAIAVNIGPLVLPLDSRYVWTLRVDGHSDPSWTLSFSTRPALAKE